MDAVTSQLNQKYAEFLVDHPGWAQRGSVSLLGHSLGSVIVLDILTHGGSTFQGVRYPRLDFPVHIFFALGSPASCFLVAVRCQHLCSKVISTHE